MSQENDVSPPTGSCEPGTQSQTRIEPAQDLVWATRVPVQETDEPPASETDQFATRVGGADTTQIPVPSQPDWPTVPGYEILGELGRGGMGVVYKARQIKLRRFVALKMIRTGPSASKEEVQRFRTEAETIARLQHPNIVQLFEFLEQKGEAFLALELIEGSSLNKNIEAPWPPQQAARLLETLARAMHYAHEQGIIHRDLKPANILLNKVRSDTVTDGVIGTVAGTGGTLQRKEGATVHRLPFLARNTNSTLESAVASFQPKITDFGLAKLMSADSAGPTVTGDFLGTPTYSAPEQASGRIHEIGPHTDVYALGVILYELLTGRPPFQGATVLDTLDQVRSQEPVPPSRLQKRVPRDLETICLKCLEKSPQRRYARALLLAEDLQAYLHGRPIKARPVTLVERGVKWARRRPALAALIFVSIIGILALIGGGWYTAIERTAAAKLEMNLRQKAEENLADALYAIENMLTEVGDVDLADVPQLEGVRKNLLVKAQTLYQKFLAKQNDSPQIRYLAGRSQGRLGEIHELLDEYSDAERSYLDARELLAETSRDSVEQQAELARVSNKLGVLLKKLGRYAESQQSLQQALDLRRKILEESPKELEYKRALADSWYDLATVLARLRGQRKQAEQAYGEALGIQEELCKARPGESNFQRDRARTLNNLGILLVDETPQKAKSAFEQAVDAYQDLVEKHAGNAFYRRELARSYNNLARIPRKAGQFKKSEEVYGKSLKLLKQLAVDFPTVPVYRQELAALYYNLGLLFQDAGNFDKADKVYREALRLRQEIADESPGLPDYRDALANVHRDVGQALEKRGLLLEADEHYQRAIVLLEKIARTAGRPAYQSDLALVLDFRGTLLLSRSKLSSALQRLESLLQSASGMPWYSKAPRQAQESLVKADECLRQAVSYQRAALTADKRNSAYPKKLYDHYQNLSVVQVLLNDHKGLAESARAFPEIYPQASASYLLAAKRLVRAVTAAATDTRLTAVQQRSVSERYVQAALQMLRDGLKHGFSTQQLQELKTSPIYAPLRRRPEFRAIIGESENGTPRNA
jgi:serine/threonine protein kinase/Tfp pilus assembly protein PilF